MLAVRFVGREFQGGLFSKKDHKGNLFVRTGPECVAATAFSALEGLYGLGPYLFLLQTCFLPPRGCNKGGCKRFVGQAIRVVVRLQA